MDVLLINKVENIVAPFATMFLKVICCRGVGKRLHVGKGKDLFTSFNLHADAFLLICSKLLLNFFLKKNNLLTTQLHSIIILTFKEINNFNFLPRYFKMFNSNSSDTTIVYCG